MEFSRQEYWSGLSFPSPGDLPDSGIKLGSPSLQVDALPSEPPGNPIMYNIQSIQIITLWTVKIKSHHLNKTKSQVFASFLSSHIVLMPEIMVRNCIPDNQSRNRYIKVCLYISMLFRVENSIIKFGYFPSWVYRKSTNAPFWNAEHLQFKTSDTVMMKRKW